MKLFDGKNQILIIMQDSILFFKGKSLNPILHLFNEIEKILVNPLLKGANFKIQPEVHLLLGSTADRH